MPRLPGRAWVIGAVTVVAAVAGAGLTAYAAHQDEDTEALQFTSVRTMAQRAGCADTFAPITSQAPARDAGDCVTKDGTHIQFRIFDDIEQARGWGSAMSESDTGPMDPSEYGPNWVVRIIDADRATANPIFKALSSGA